MENRILFVTIDVRRGKSKVIGPFDTLRQAHNFIKDDIKKECFEFGYTKMLNLMSQNIQFHNFFLLYNPTPGTETIECLWDLIKEYFVMWSFTSNYKIKYDCY